MISIEWKGKAPNNIIQSTPSERQQVDGGFSEHHEDMAADMEAGIMEEVSWYAGRGTDQYGVHVFD